jgi:hypothetical protein
MLRLSSEDGRHEENNLYYKLMNMIKLECKLKK